MFSFDIQMFAQIGLQKFHYAILSKDDSSGVEYGTPKRVVGLNSVDINPTVNRATLYGDDAPMATANSLTEITVRIESGDLPLEDEAALLGHTISDGKMICKAEDEAPNVAVMFKSKKHNGETRYIKLLKGKFAEVQQTLNTKGENVDFQLNAVEGSFVAREYDKAWKCIADAENDSLDSTWFASVEGTETVNDGN